MEEHMSSHGIRLGGWLLLIGGLLSAVTILLPYLIVGPGGPGGVPVVPINVLSIIGALLLIGGLPAFYACQAKQTGWVGLVGVVALGMTELLLDTDLKDIFNVSARKRSPGDNADRR